MDRDNNNNNNNALKHTAIEPQNLNPIIPTTDVA